MNLNKPENQSSFTAFCTQNQPETTLIFLNMVNLSMFNELCSITSLNLISLRENDYICLFDCPKIRKIAMFYKKIFNYKDDQFIFWSLDSVNEQKDMIKVYENILSRFKFMSNVVVVSLLLYDELEEVCLRLGIRTCSNPMGRLPDKRILQPTVPGSIYTNNLWGLSEIKDVSIPRGYSCNTHEEIIKARVLLKEQGIVSLYIKHCQALSGRLNFILEDINDERKFKEILNKITFDPWSIYKYEARACWIVEEKLILKKIEENEENNLLLSMNLTKNMTGFNPSVALSVIGEKVCYQLVNYSLNGHACAVTNYYKDEHIIEEGVKQYESLSKVLKGIVNYPSEIEFLIDEKDKIYLTDLNFRFSAKDQIFFFLEKFKIENKSWAHRTIQFPLNIDDVEEILINERLLFNINNDLTGVIPDVPIENDEFQSILFIGNSNFDVNLLIFKTFNLIHQRLNR